MELPGLDVAQLLQNILMLASGSAGVFVSVKMGKKIKWIPINKGQKKLLIGSAGVLSAIALVLMSLATSEGLPASLQDVMVKVLELATIWYGAHATHKTLKK